MQAFRHFLGRLIPVAALLVMLPAPGIAQTDQMDQDAIAFLRHATDYLSKMKQLRVETATTVEVVVSNGQKLQYLHRSVLAVQRPNKMRAERVGELVAQTFYYDGKMLSLSMPEEKFYATVAAPATLDATLDFARDKLEIIAPATDLIYSNAFQRLSEGLTAAYFVGEAMVGGVKCTHLAFRNAEVDWQLWLRQDEAKPLPCKFVITSKKMPQSPQFEVLMSKWDTAPKLTDAMFHFTPPKGSQKIDFTPTALNTK